MTDPDDKRDIMLKFTEITAPEAGAENTKVYYENAKDAIDVWKVTIEVIRGKARHKELYFGEQA